MSQPLIKLGLPKGRMEQEVFKLMGEAGAHVRAGGRTYRPSISLPEFDAKILKPHDIVEMIALGSRDIGFAGADWVMEMQLDIVELLDTGLDPVRLVAAAPEDLLENDWLPKRHLVIASEYQRITQQWIADKKIDATFVLSHGSTEVFPPEDADCIVDNTATGSTLKANNLKIIDTLTQSSTRLYANRQSLSDPKKRHHIERFVLLIASVLEARKRVMLELNVSCDNLERVIAVLPCLREPTVSPLHGEQGYAVKAAVPRAELPEIIPLIKESGGTGIVVTAISQLVR